MARTYRQPGEVLTWESTVTDVDAGDVVLLADTIGVALVDIDLGEEGSVSIAGVHELPKADSQEWTLGEVLNYDESGEEFTTSAVGSGDIEGGAIAAADAADGDREADVLLLPGTGSVQP